MVPDSAAAPSAASDLDPERAIAFLRTLRQVRQMRPDPIPDAVLRDILEVARWTGSGGNNQPWEFVVVQDRETLRALAEAHSNMPFLANAAVAIVIVLAGGWEGEMYDEGRLSERIMLAAKAHGLAAALGWPVLIEGGAAARRILGIPEERVLHSAVAIGYPVEEAVVGRATMERPRKPLSELVYLDRYGQRAAAEG